MFQRQAYCAELILLIPRNWFFLQQMKFNYLIIEDPTRASLWGVFHMTDNPPPFCKEYLVLKCSKDLSVRPRKWKYSAVNDILVLN
jgi:hypothetical protein